MERTGHGVPDVLVEVRTECTGSAGNPSPTCAQCGHRAAPGSTGRLGHHRRAQLVRSKPLYFGSEQPDDNRAWLQVGPYGPFDGPTGKTVSGVTGCLWISYETGGGGGRVMLENLSERVRIEVHSPRLPAPELLHPVDHWTGHPRDRWLGTPITALQAHRSTLVLVNRDQRFDIDVSLQTSDWGNGHLSADTSDPGAAGGRVDQATLTAAAKRITLGAQDHLPLLREFLDMPVVRANLQGNPNVTALRTKQVVRDGERVEEVTRLDAYCAKQLNRVAQGNPTHWLHVLILAGLGEPIEHPAHYYTKIVKEHLVGQPDPDTEVARGGNGGPGEILETVRATFRFRPRQLRSYLRLDPPGRDRSLVE